MIGLVMGTVLAVAAPQAARPHAARPAAPAAAPASSSPDQVAAARLAAARTLVQMMRVEEQMRVQQAKPQDDVASGLFDRLIPAQVAMRAQLADPQGFARAKEQVTQIVTDDRKALGNETIPLMIEADVRRYADHFSLDELRQLTDFYRSPLGQRLVAEQPRMAADSAQFQQTVLTPIANAHNATVMPKLMAVLASVVKQAGITNPADAAAAAAKKK